MREIIFRGKRADNDKWIYGYYLEEYRKDKTKKSCIFDSWTDGEKVFNHKEMVLPKTVGQFTGLCDKNGKKIFEGDIVYIRFGHGNCVVGKAIVYFDEKLLQYRVKAIKPYAYDGEVGDLYKDCDFTHIDECEVIGNIHDQNIGKI